MSAVFSPCRRYRLLLERIVGPSPRTANFIMLNPSTADEEENDPTIRRCMDFTRRLGCGRLLVTNLFAVRATSPKDMLAADDPVGEENDRYVKKAAQIAHNIYAEAFNEQNGHIICAWGAHGGYMDQDLTVLGWIGHYPLQALGVTKSGQPRHPLYLRADAELTRYKGRM